MFLIITGDSSYLDIDNYITEGVGIPSDSLDGDLLGAHGKFMDQSQSHLAHLSILRQYGIASGSTVNQHSLPAPVDIGIAHIQWSQPAGVGVIIPVGRVSFFVVYCWAMTSALTGIAGCGCATTTWGARPPFALGPCSCLTPLGTDGYDPSGTWTPPSGAVDTHTRSAQTPYSCDSAHLSSLHCQPAVWQPYRNECRVSAMGLLVPAHQGCHSQRKAANNHRWLVHVHLVQGTWCAWLLAHSGYPGDNGSDPGSVALHLI